jgi:hypothetical protein
MFLPVLQSRIIFMRLQIRLLPLSLACRYSTGTGTKNFHFDVASALVLARKRMRLLTTPSAPATQHWYLPYAADVVGR